METYNNILKKLSNSKVLQGIAIAMSRVNKDYNFHQSSTLWINTLATYIYTCKGYNNNSNSFNLDEKYYFKHLNDVFSRFSRKLEHSEMELLKPHIEKMLKEISNDKENQTDMYIIPIDKLKKSKILKKEINELIGNQEIVIPSLWVSVLARHLYKKPFDFGNGKTGIFTINTNKFKNKINKELGLRFFDKLTAHEIQFLEGKCNNMIEDVIHKLGLKQEQPDQIDSIERRLFLEKGLQFGAAIMLGGSLLAKASNAEAGRRNMSGIFMQMQYDQLGVILYLMHLNGEIDLKNKVIIIPKDGFDSGNYGLITKWDRTPTGIQAPEGFIDSGNYGLITKWDRTPTGIQAAQGFIDSGNYGLITKWDRTPTGIRAPEEFIDSGNYGLITKWDRTPTGIQAPEEFIDSGNYGLITKWDRTPTGIQAPEEFIDSGNYGLITKWDRTPTGIQAPEEFIDSGNYGLITKILIIPVVEFNKNPKKFTNS